jgi:hypothetical protein
MRVNIQKKGTIQIRLHIEKIPRNVIDDFGT